MKALATNNAVFEDVAKSMFMYSCDKDVLEQCRKVEDNQRFMAYQQNKIESLEASNANLMANNIGLKANNIELKANNIELKTSNNELKASNDKLKASNADKDNQIAEQAVRIAYLEAQLNKNK
jgi:predicted RNase H-like nuclease (RuvC/YqgF family)